MSGKSFDNTEGGKGMQKWRKGLGLALRVAASNRPGRPADEGEPGAETRKQRKAASGPLGTSRLGPRVVDPSEMAEEQQGEE